MSSSLLTNRSPDGPSGPGLETYESVEARQGHEPCFATRREASCITNRRASGWRRRGAGGHDAHEAWHGDPRQHLLRARRLSRGDDVRGARLAVLGSRRSRGRFVASGDGGDALGGCANAIFSGVKIQAGESEPSHPNLEREPTPSIFDVKNRHSGRTRL